MPLGTEALSRIVDIQIERIRERVISAYGVDLTLTEEARAALVARAGASEIGARALKS